jgi:hypothetical protein
VISPFPARARQAEQPAMAAGATLHPQPLRRVDSPQAKGDPAERPIESIDNFGFVLPKTKSFN